MSNPKVGDPFKDGLQVVGPRIVRREGGRDIEERLPVQFKPDEERELDELMHGVSSSDLRGPASGFMRHRAQLGVGEQNQPYDPPESPPAGRRFTANQTQRQALPPTQEYEEPTWETSEPTSDRNILDEIESMFEGD